MGSTRVMNLAPGSSAAAVGAIKTRPRSVRRYASSPHQQRRIIRALVDGHQVDRVDVSEFRPTAGDPVVHGGRGPVGVIRRFRGAA
jgi:hypothetical protein